MNERIFDMARQKGATDEHGNQAVGVFCFTKDELEQFAELLVRESLSVQNKCPHHIAAGKFVRAHFGIKE